MGEMGHDSSSASSRVPFDMTDWRMVMLAGQEVSPLQTQALENLCRTYWCPVHAYLIRQGYARADAKDLTQEFFARLLQKDFLKNVDRAKGKFRSFLLGALKHFLANEWDKSRAEKRGGKHTFVSLDEDVSETEYQFDSMSAGTPESLYDFHWALTVIEEAFIKLKAEEEAKGKRIEFAELQIFLTNEPASGDYAKVAVQLGTTKDAVAQAVHRLRDSYGALLEKEVARTVTRPVEIDEEMDFIKEVFRLTRGAEPGAC